MRCAGLLKKYPTFVMSYEYTQGRYVGEAHQSGPRVAREAGVSPAQYPLLEVTPYLSIPYRSQLVGFFYSIRIRVARKEHPDNP